MRGLWTIAAAGLGLLAMPALADTGNRSAGTGAAAASVITPIVLTHATGASLNFGKFTAGPLGGTVVVSTTGAGSATSDVTFVPGSAVSTDSFSVRGDANRSFAVSATNSFVTTGGAWLGFVASVAPSSITLNSSGAASFLVGGTLTVAGNAPPGSYAGTYSVTVTYN